MITIKDIEKMATLAKLYISADELEEYIRETQAILELSEALDDALIDEEEFVSINTPLREDEVKDSLPREEILSNTEYCRDGFFAVRKKA